MKKLIAIAAMFPIFVSGVYASGTGLDQLRGSAPAAEIAVPAPGQPKGMGGDGGEVHPTGSFAAAARTAYRGNANYITLYAMPSPSDMDWSNITRLAGSAAYNALAVKLGDKHVIGHVAFEIGCTLNDGRRVTLVSGQSPSDGMGGFADQVMDGAGYNAFFGHVPGRLQTRSELEGKMDQESNTAGDVAFLTLKVSQASCLEALRYVNAYRDEGVYKRYGLGVRPLYKEGGGCANVGVSVVEVAGPAGFEALARPWSRTFYVPNELLGSEGDPVGAGTLLDYWKYDWTRPTAKPHKKLFFYDPDLIYKWVLHPATNMPYQRYRLNKSPGVTLDFTGASAPTQWWKTDRN